MASELMILGGERVPAADGTTYEVIEPGTGRPMARVSEAGTEDAASAARIAHRAFEEGAWRRMSGTQRGRVLLRAASLLRERSEQMATVESRNVGKPIRWARGEVETVAGVLEYWGGAANKIFGETIPVSAPGLDLTLREPVGPCVLITPWNYPLVISSWKIGPALACGNPMIVKPASLTPLSVLLLADVLVEAGLPPETISVLPGPGAPTGEALVRDPLVAKVSFTGSTAVGVRVMQHGAEHITRVSLELGGKSANVVFADADMDRCIEESVWAVFGNTGQDCTARTRLFVERPVYERFVDGLAARTQRLRIGPPTDEATELGPMISAAQRRTSLEYLEVGRDEGARLVMGGDVPEELEEGFFLRPAILADASNDMRVAREEIFGPVACAIPFDAEGDAVRMANDGQVRTFL